MTAYYDRVKEYEDGGKIREFSQPCSNCQTPIEDFIDEDSKDFAKPLSEINMRCSMCHDMNKRSLMRDALLNTQLLIINAMIKKGRVSMKSLKELSDKISEALEP